MGETGQLTRASSAHVGRVPAVIPLHDQNPTRTLPIVTILLMAACVVVYFFIQPSTNDIDGADFSFKNAAIPCEIVQGRPLTQTEYDETTNEGDGSACDEDASSEERSEFPQKSPYLSILYSMFLHGGLLHLGGNMLFLWVFGNNIEDHAGKVKYLLFYLAAGLVATIAQIGLDPASTIPMIGASGAVAGVMGAYLVMFPNIRIHTLFFMFIIFFREIQAKWLLGFWFVSQFFTSPDAGVAWMAHVGGFVFGVLAGFIWRARPASRDRRRPWPAAAR